MLVKYKKNYEKIVMGFLSYLDDFKNLNNLQEEMDLYHTNNGYQIFLYRPEDGDFEGIVGIQSEQSFVLMRYISLTPAYRDREHQLRILADLQTVFPNDKILSVPENAELMQEFESKKNG